MTEEFTFEDHELPDDLKALDAELASIRYEERPSFGPERWSKSSTAPPPRSGRT